jgi:hypothetical protein
MRPDMRFVIAAVLFTFVTAAQVPKPEPEGTPATYGSHEDPWFKKSPKKGDPNIRRLAGSVRFPDDSLAVGAAVKVKNRTSGETVVYTTDAKGNYIFESLTMKVDYDVWAEYKDRKSNVRVLSTFISQQDVTMDLKLPPPPVPAATAKK